MVKPNETDRLLQELSADIRRDFQESGRLLSFGEYVQLVRQNPRRHLRSAAQYLRDAFDHFGSYEVRTPAGTMRRFRLFDGLPGGEEYVVGQEEAQHAFYRLLTHFSRQGRVNRLVMLHGPNGSAKSSFVACMARALELYSETDEGQLYRFNWIFPTEKISRGAIGFGETATSRTSTLPTYAYLEDVEINARLIDPLRDPPLFLLPTRERRALMERFLKPEEEQGAKEQADEDNRHDREFILSDYLQRGDLNDRNRRIADTLLASYHGDFGEVLKHIQVERFFLSRRYREGLAVVGPQLRVDAGLRQLTSDRSLSSLPPSLQNLTLFEPHGELVDGNRGMVEFEDLFKRPMDLNRYLLSTSESGKVSLEHSTLFIDTVLVGSANELYLDALKATPEWASYKGRLELVRIGYILDYLTERKIYDVQLERMEIGKPVAPHVTELAALWAVLTRLTRPKPDRYPELLRSVIKRLTPRQKADLYATGKLPEGVTGEESRELKAKLEEVYEEATHSAAYEGRQGASPREIRSVLLNAIHNDKYPCFSPLALFAELKKLVEDPTVYEFLRLDPDGEYQRPAEFVEQITQEYLDRVDYEVRSAMGLIAEAQYQQLFERYVTHVNHWIRKEQLFNPISRRYEPPSEKLMADVEKLLGPGEVEKNPTEYRNSIISSIGAFRIENPTSPVDYEKIFSRQLDLLKRRFLDERKDSVQKIKINLLRFFDDQVDDLAALDREQVLHTFQALEREFGYTRQTAREAIGFLVGHRYDGQS
ncbi:MAG: hypothetical protein JW797_17275 [Bradymonadales bacterium]|nr:hypothetical protein [Bradymonadales bacterium]